MFGDPVKLASILLPLGFRFGPATILPAQPVGKRYCVELPSGSRAADGSVMGVGAPALDAIDNESGAPYLLSTAMVKMAPVLPLLGSLGNDGVGSGPRD